MSGPFYHYTCDHGRQGLGDIGVAVPAWHLTRDRWFWTAEFLWLTDLPEPDAEMLGLTQRRLRCDRTAHRYVVARSGAVVPWLDVNHPNAWELAEAGGDPARWFVSTVPLAVRYAPLSLEAAS